MLGQVAVTAGVGFGAASVLNAYLDLEFGYPATPGHTITLFAVILIAHGLLNTFGVRLVALLGTVSVWWHVLGVAVIVGALALVPDHHRSASFVFTRFVNETGWHSTLYVVLISLLGALALGLPYLINVTAYTAVTSIAVIGLYIAYVIPTFLRLLRLGDRFERGPWHLGRWSRAVGVVAVGWVALITVLFMLPQSSPVTVDTFNYAPIAVLVVLGFVASWWAVSARRWFLRSADEPAEG